MSVSNSASCCAKLIFSSLAVAMISASTHSTVFFKYETILFSKFTIFFPHTHLKFLVKLLTTFCILTIEVHLKVVIKVQSRLKVKGMYHTGSVPTVSRCKTSG